MARKLRIRYEGAIRHVTFRGNARQSIFGDDRDRERLTERVGASAEDFGVRVCEYCWMGNHGHLALETPAANVSAFAALALIRRRGQTEKAAAAELGLGTGSAVSYLVRQVKARCRVEPDTADLVRRVACAEVSR